MLTRQLKLDHSRISVRAQRETLIELGYMPHPALEGRTNHPVMPDGVKADLYVQREGIPAQLPNAAAVARAYEKAQHPTDMAAVFGEAK